MKRLRGNPDKRALMREIRAQFPGFRAAVLADASTTALNRGERDEFRSRLDAVVQILRLCWVCDAFGAQVLYRLKTSLQAREIPVLPRIAHRLSMALAQVSIGDPVIVRPGLYLIHGQVVIDGLVEVGPGAVIAPWVTIGLKAGNVQGATIGSNVQIGTGAKVVGPVRIGSGAQVGANAVVVDDVAEGSTVVGAPARTSEASGETSERMGDRPVTPDPARIPPHPMAEFFEPMREYRRARFAGYDPRAGAERKRAIVTMVRDEAVFLPIWLDYYSRYFAPEDIYVLDHETSDGSTDREGFVRIPVAHDAVDHVWMVETIQECHRDLIERYDVVLTTDVDEIVAPHPEMGTLGQYMDRFDEEFVNCIGYELLHMHETEPAFDPGRPVLEQRGHWFANDGYDKPVLTTTSMEWVPGFHGRADGRFNPDPDLRLIHLHRMDYEICRQRHLLREERRWADKDLELSWATHNRLTGGEEFDRWFYEDSSSDGVEIVVEGIPPAWRGLF